MEFITFIMAHQAEALGIFGAAMALGGAVVKLTPTKKDDAWFKAIKRALGITVACMLMVLPLGCGSGLMGIGNEWTTTDCATLDLATFMQGYVCTGQSQEVCRHSAFSAYHAGMAICLGISDEDEEPG